MVVSQEYSRHSVFPVAREEWDMRVLVPSSSRHQRMHACCPGSSIIFEYEVHLKEVSYQGVIKGLCTFTIWGLGARLGKESTVHADELLTHIVPVFQEIIDTCYGSLANSQCPGMLFPPFSTFYVYFRFLQFSGC